MPEKKAGGFSAEERAAMKAHAKELKLAASKADEAKALQEAIAGMDDGDRKLAERIDAIVTKNAPGLFPKTWYGMPAWATEDGKAVIFFQPSGKFKARYSTLGFNDSARLDDGNVWATTYAVTKLSAADEKTIGALVKKAAG